MKVRCLFAAALAAMLGVLGGCDAPQKFNSADITGANYAHDFALSDSKGVLHTLADYRGKVVVVFFGYTQCPDVCPTTLSDMAEVKKRLGADGDKLQVLFVTLDPERDTPALLAQYTPAFDPSFVGLYGSPEQTAATAKAFKVFYQKVPDKSGIGYTLDHTAGSYVFDPQGRVRLFMRYSQAPDEVVADIRKLMG